MGLFDKLFSGAKGVSPLNFLFKSADHIRYEHGKHVSGPHEGGARRAIKVEPNINGGEGYTVSIYNLDGNHPVWQNNLQMAPKQMKVMEQGANKIVLRGYGFDETGAPFSDYGFTIYRKGDVIEKCIGHMHDRGVDIEYLPDLAAALLDNAKQMLYEVVKNTASKIEAKFGTVVNDYGCLHCSEPMFKEFTLPEDRNRFLFCNYFIIPVDYEYKLVLPKSYHRDSETILPNYTSLIESSSVYRWKEYLSKLGTYEQLKRFTENYTSGATAVITKILKHPVNPAPNKLIDDVGEMEDLAYLVLCYYIDGI
jgi:hypothetical protein